ncbi:MAG: hypothetical protein ACK448_07665, partial [Bacteroidota bacterium]
MQHRRKFLKKLGLFSAIIGGKQLFAGLDADQPHIYTNNAPNNGNKSLTGEDANYPKNNDVQIIDSDKIINKKSKTTTELLI